MEHSFRPPLRLTSDLEQRFGADYYERVHPGLRLVSLLLAVLVAFQTQAQADTPLPLGLAVSVPELVFCLCVLGLTWVRGFGRMWRLVLVLLGWAVAVLVLATLGHALGAPPGPIPGGPPHPPSSVPMRFSFIRQMSVLMVTLSTLRLPFRAAALIQGGVFVIGL